jgi:hypothetical protein
MRTTLDLPDDLFRQVKAKAALEGASLKEMLTRFVEGGLRRPTLRAGQLAGRSSLPVIPKRSPIPNLTPELLDKLEEEDDLAKLRRSFGH